MTFNPDGFHAVAKKLSLNQIVPNDEARRRTVAGRSYYAVFLATYEAIRDKYRIGGNKFPKHETLVEELGRDSHPKSVQKLGALLGSLKAARVKADYKLHEGIDEDACDITVYDAEMALAMIPQVVADLPKIDPVD